jgi:hypothetical protein
MKLFINKLNSREYKIWPELLYFSARNDIQYVLCMTRCVSWRDRNKIVTVISS